MSYEIDFLPVGNGEKCGDAIALRFGNLFGKREEQTVIIIDGGFKESGESLVAHIREYYKTDYVDLVISTHPDADHAGGLEIFLNELNVGSMWMHQPWNHTDDIAKMFKDGRVTDNSVRESLRKSLDTTRNLERLANSKRIPIIEPFCGLKDNSGHLFVLGPKKDFYEELLPGFRGTPEPKDDNSLLKKGFYGIKEFIEKIAERWDYETLDDNGETTAENNSSTILLLAVDNHNLLFTGDAGIPALTNALDSLYEIGFDFSTISFVQVPHHGSRRNVGPTILDRLLGQRQAEDKKLKTSFVSVSNNGSIKHPSKKVTNAFRRRGAYVHATKGLKKYHYSNSPDRGWSASVPLPFYDEVDEFKN